MLVPRNQNKFCPSCAKHTPHKLDFNKKHKKRKDSIGERRFQKKFKGYGSFPKPMPSGKKPTQRQDLRYKCGTCNKMHTVANAFRVKKFEFTE